MLSPRMTAHPQRFTDFLRQFRLVGGAVCWRRRAGNARTRSRAAMIVDSGMGMWDRRGPSCMLNAIARSATLLFFYNLDQLISRVRPRSVLLLGDERPANPMIDLRRKPHEHLRVLISGRIGNVVFLHLSIDFESLEGAGRRCDGFLCNDLGQARAPRVRACLRIARCVG